MKIGYLSTDWSFDFTDVEGFPTPGGAGWYRCHLPARYLERNGIDAVVCPLPVLKSSGEIMLSGWDDQIYDDLDVIVIQRWMSERAEAVIRKARSTGQVIINDIDDWYPGLDPANSAWQNSHPRRNIQMNRSAARKLNVGWTSPFNINYYMAAVRASTAVTVSTPFLVDKFPGAHLVRNAIDLENWQDLGQTESESPVIGWMGGTAQRSGDLELLRGFLRAFVEQHRLYVVHAGYVEGAIQFEQLAGLAEGSVYQVPSCPARFVPQLPEKFEVGLVPLRDIGFNQAKRAIKGMEYAAAGRPFVASPTEEYEWLCREHGIGKTARKPKEWLRELERLLDPVERRAEAERACMSMKALDMAERWVDWLDVYTSIRA